jgi:type II secretion system protein I
VPRRGNGFTLIEVVVALAIMGTASIAALASFGAMLATAGRGAERLETAELAQERLARLALLSPDELRHPPDSLARGAFPAPFEAYRWTARTQPLRDDPDLVDVTLEVSSESQSVALHTRWYRPLLRLGAS